MYATKTPSLRINHSDLKCKSGCGFYGNAQWQGYCSKCHREQAHRQRRAEKVTSASTSVNQREHQVLERQPKTSPVAGFSKFEEKKLRQSDSLKKNKLLKLNVFRKASNAKDVGSGENSYRDRGPSELTIPSVALEAQRRDFLETFPNLNPIIERDTRKCIQAFFSSIVKQYQCKTVDELSESTQNFYQVFARRMDNSPCYSDVDPETKELLLDFVEKHSMTYLHSVLFSPATCDDEKKDAQLQTRIRQLCWVTPQHLDCRIDQKNALVRDLLYSAISELVGVDSVFSPGGKLSRVVECCRGVVAVIKAAGGKPASADELLPAVIFTVLKANPPRLTSNINFVTRFCNAARLMSGEGGYYFTNLCCAVSFIENLTSESLNMSKEEFDANMRLPAIVGSGSWVAALSLCEGLRETQEQLKALKDLEIKANTFENDTLELADHVQTFKEEFLKKVNDVLQRTPLDFNRKTVTDKSKQETSIVQPIIEPPNVAVENTIITESNVDRTKDLLDSVTDDTTAALLESIPCLLNESKSPIKTPEIAPVIQHYMPPNSLVDLSLDNPPISTLKTIGSGEFLSPSPIFGFGSFDTQSLDELATPDDFGSEHFLQGSTINVNYDIDLSDLSADNSVTEDHTVVTHKVVYPDPFSPEGLISSDRLQAWQPLQAEALKPAESTASFMPPVFPLPQVCDEAASILDSNDSPTTDCLLPSPIKPVNTSFQ